MPSKLQSLPNSKKKEKSLFKSFSSKAKNSADLGSNLKNKGASSNTFKKRKEVIKTNQ